MPIGWDGVAWNGVWGFLVTKSWYDFCLSVEGTSSDATLSGSALTLEEFVGPVRTVSSFTDAVAPTPEVASEVCMASYVSLF